MARVGGTGFAITQLSLAPHALVEPRSSGEDPRQCPRLGTIVKRVAISLLIACAIPATLFYSVFSVAGVWTAVLVALGWSYGAIAFRALTGRRTSGLLILTAVVM